MSNIIYLSFLFSYKLNTFKALESWLRIGAISLENIDKSEVMHEAFSTLSNVQGKEILKKSKLRIKPLFSQLQCYS